MGHPKVVGHSGGGVIPATKILSAEVDIGIGQTWNSTVPHHHSQERCLGAAGAQDRVQGAQP